MNLRNASVKACLVTFLAVAACGGNPAPAAPAATPVPTPVTMVIKESEFMLDPKDQTLKPGAFVFHASNVGKAPHDLHIIDSSGAEVAALTPVVMPGQEADLRVTLKAGTYTIFCGVGMHRQRGMEGKLTVQ